MAKSTNAASSLSAQDISVWFGDRQVLKDVNLLFPANQVTALIGPSGCGKSTFIRTLNRMHELIPGAGLAGSVLLDGEDIYASSMNAVDVRIKIGMVFQKPNPFPTMSIRENVISGLKLSGRKNENIDELVETSLRRAS
ncbi:MAG: phosphate ABC transporter ATP-binding protein, partial [Rhodoluna sp.]